MPDQGYANSHGAIGIFREIVPQQNRLMKAPAGCIGPAEGHSLPATAEGYRTAMAG